MNSPTVSCSAENVRRPAVSFIYKSYNWQSFIDRLAAMTSMLFVYASQFYGPLTIEHTAMARIFTGFSCIHTITQHNSSQVLEYGWLLCIYALLALYKPRGIKGIKYIQRIHIAHQQPYPFLCPILYSLHDRSDF